MSANSRFAVSVHMLAYLAYQHDRAVPSAEIASSVSTNPVVIRRLLSALVKAGLVKTRQGAAGGFRLARPAASVSLCDIYHAVEPHPSHGMNRFAPNHRCPVGAKIEDVLRGVFAQAQAGMERELSQISLAHLEHQLRPVCTARRD